MDEMIMGWMNGMTEINRVNWMDAMDDLIPWERNEINGMQWMG